MNKQEYRKDLPPIPERLLSRPVERGYPVPWFVAEIDGKYDFRVVDARKYAPAINKKLCWICGERLGATFVFAIGPMCAINRVNSEPPSHRDCAEFSVKACPFLIQQQTKRNEANLPVGHSQPAGIGISRQPGVVLLWTTKKYEVFDAGNGILFKLGEPLDLSWWRMGRAAKRAEILESIETGLPILREMAQIDGRFAEQQLEDQIKRGMKLVPADDMPRRKSLASNAKSRI